MLNKIRILDTTLLNQIKQSKCMASTAQMSIDHWECNGSIHCIYWDVLNYGNLSGAAYSRIVSHVHLAVGPTWLYSFCFEQMKLRNVPSVASKVTFVMLVCSYWKGSQFNLSSDLLSLCEPLFDSFAPRLGQAHQDQGSEIMVANFVRSIMGTMM